MTFGTWNVMSLYLSGSLTTIARELARNKLGFCVCVCVCVCVCTGGVCWEEGETVRGEDYVLYLGKKNNNHPLVTG